MAVFIKEDSEQSRKKTIKVPEKLVTKAKNITTLVDAQDGNKRKKDGSTSLKGYKRMKKIENLAQKNGSYNSNDKSTTSDDDNAYITFGDAKRALHDMEHAPKNSMEYQVNGGDEMKDFYKREVQRVRRSNKPVSQVQQVKPNSVKVKQVQDNTKKGLEPITVKENKKKVCISEEQLKLLK